MPPRASISVAFFFVKSSLDEIPRIICGAEVKYYPGIGKLESLSKLCIGESNLILLEMPMGKWTEYTVRELTEIAVTHRVRVILAHIDRYLKLESDSSLFTLHFQKRKAFFDTAASVVDAGQNMRMPINHFLSLFEEP